MAAAPKAGAALENKEPAVVVVVVVAPNGEPNTGAAVVVLEAAPKAGAAVVVIDPPPKAEPKVEAEVVGAPKTGAEAAGAPNTELDVVVVAPKIGADEVLAVPNTGADAVVVTAPKAGVVLPKTFEDKVAGVLAKMEGAVVFVVLNARNEEVVVAIAVEDVVAGVPKVGAEETAPNVEGALKVLLVDLLKPKLAVVVEMDDEAPKLNVGAVVAAAVVVVVTLLLAEGNKFLEMLLVAAPAPNAKGLLEELGVVVATTGAVGLPKLNPPLPKPEELVVATRLGVVNVDGVVEALPDVVETEEVGATVAVLTPNIGAVDTAELDVTVDVLTPNAPELVEGDEVNDKLAGNLKLLETVLGGSSFFAEGIENALLLGILKAPIDDVVVDVGKETLGLTLDAEEATKSNLKPPTLGGDVVEVAETSPELVVVVVIVVVAAAAGGGDFPNENVGVETAEETVEMALDGRGRDVVAGDDTALTVAVVVLLMVKAGRFVVFVGV